MKNFFKKLGHALQEFFKSLGSDFSNLVKKHWLKLIGYILIFIVPLVYIIATYIVKKPEKWTFPIFVWIPVIVLLIVYWCKLKSYLAIKVHAMTVENNIEEGKHAGAIIVITFIRMVMTVAPFALGYYVFNMLEQASISIKDIFLILTLLVGAGAFLIVLDTISSVTKDEPTEETPNE